jgi:hypothetical protein
MSTGVNIPKNEPYRLFFGINRQNNELDIIATGVITIKRLI